MGPVTLLARYRCTGCGLGSEWLPADGFSVDMPAPGWLPSVLLPCPRCKAFGRVRYSAGGGASDASTLVCAACSSTVDPAPGCGTDARAPLRQLLCDLWFLATLGTAHGLRWNRSYKSEHSRRLIPRVRRSAEDTRALIDDNALLSCPGCQSRAIEVCCRLEEPDW